MADSLTTRIKRDVSRLRRVRGLTAQELARRLGAGVARRLGDGLDLTLAELQVLARALGADVQVRLTPKRLPTEAADLRRMASLLEDAMARSHDPLARYAAGKIVATVKRDPRTYGDSAVGSLATMVGEDLPSLYRFAAVAESFTRSEVVRLLAGGLTWSHLVVLAKLGDPKKRAAWAKRALHMKGGSRELERRLARERGAREA